MLGEGLAALGLGVKLVGKVASGRADERELKQLAVRYWGCALFELGHNLRRIQACMRQNMVVPTIQFSVFDVVIGDLARLAPAPEALNELNELAVQLRVIANLAQGRTPGVFDPTAWSEYYRRTGTYLEHQYDALRDLLDQFGREAHGDKAWQRIQASVVPADLESLQQQKENVLRVLNRKTSDGDTKGD